MAERTIPGIKAALTIGGSDSSGAAGIQGDIKVWTTMQIHACAALTAVGVRNTQKVARIEPLDPALIAEQIDAVANDLHCQVTKTGLMPNTQAVKAVAQAIKRLTLQPLIVDPTLITKTGDRLADDETMVAISKQLFPLAAVVTPNPFELARLLGGKTCKTLGEAASGAKELKRKFACHAVIVKGFQRPAPQEGSPDEMVDILYDGQEIIELIGEFRPSVSTTGAGTVLAAAIAGGILQGLPLIEAALQAKRIVTESIRHATDLGAGKSPINHTAWLNTKK